ncbi:MAG: antibiotic ABC transporter permease [Halapricum sp.]
MVSNHRSPAGRQHASLSSDSAAAAGLAALEYAARREYTGWDYADGMSSRIRQALPFDNRWVNLAFQETIKRSPVNVRPLFLVEQRRNFKGTALFALAHREFDRTSIDADVEHAREATRLADWLLDNQCPGYSGFCGGHRHENQHLDHRTFPSEPDVVSTSYGVKALLAVAEYDRQYENVARTAEAFLVEDMHYREVEGGAKVDYYPKDTADHYTLNAGALAARTLVDLYAHVGEDPLCERARKLLDYVVARQTDRGGWYYRDPPDASHLSMDTHHNGFVIECLQRYREVTGSQRYDEALDRAVEFFRSALFEADGAPRFDESAAYPRDVHAAAQGILVFTYAGDLRFAGRIVDWTLEHLYAGDGRFYVQKRRFYTKRITLMRWCQAWMAYALAVYCRATEPASA